MTGLGAAGTLLGSGLGTVGLALLIAGTLLLHARLRLRPRTRTTGTRRPIAARR